MKPLKNNPTNSPHFQKVKAFVGKSKTFATLPPEVHQNLGGGNVKPVFDFPKTKDLPKRKTDVGQVILPQSIGRTKIV